MRPTSPSKRLLTRRMASSFWSGVAPRTFHITMCLIVSCQQQTTRHASHPPSGLGHSVRDNACAFPCLSSFVWLTKFLDHLLAHLELLYLARHGRGELTHHADVAGYLVVSDLVAAMGADRVLVELRPGAKNDPGAELFAVPFVGHTDHLHVLDVWVPMQELLDLAWIDVLPAADDHILDTADDAAVAIIVDGCEVTGVHPAVGVDCFAGLGLVVPIAQHHRVSARAELTGFTARQGPAIVADDLYFKVGLNLADRGDSQLDRVVAAALEAHRTRLSHAVGDRDFGHVHLGHDLFHHLRWARCSSHDPAAQR